MQEKNYNEVLKRTGLKNTKHRNSIFEAVEKKEQPVTAEQIFMELKNNKISINLSSVYRILDTFVEKGLMEKTSISGENKALFGMNHQEHKHHLICSGCRKMLSVEGCPLGEYEKQLQDKLGFDVTGHRLEIYGICQECRLVDVKGD